MKYLSILTFLLIIVLFPDLASSAAPSPLVPCDGSPSDPCNACKLVELGNRLVVWLVGILMVVFAIIAVWAGFDLVTSGGNPDAKTKAKSKFTNAFIGLIIVLAAWLLIDTGMKSLLSGGNGELDNGVVTTWGPWHKIQCTSPIVSPLSGGSCTNCVAIPTSIPVKSVNACSGSGPCTVSPIISLKLGSLNSKLAAGSIGTNWQITEAWPPTVIHQNSCHLAGTCIDANFTGNVAPTAENVKIFIIEAENSGLKAVYEVSSQESMKSLVDGGVPVSNIDVVEHITAPHFSVYSVEDGGSVSGTGGDGNSPSEGAEENKN